MKKFVLLCSIAFATATGCGDAGDDILSTFKSAKEKTCACKDLACVEKVEQELEAWMEKNKDKFEKVKPTKEQDEQFDKLQDETAACRDKIAGAAETK